MQCRAIFEAACTVQKEGKTVKPEIMIPLVGMPKELTEQKAIVDRVAQEVFKETGVKVEYMTGTMIEVPRAAVVADKIAETAEFFSFGTNDLTQMTFRILARRCRQIHRRVYEARDSEVRSVPGTGPGRRGRADEDGVREGADDASEPQGRNLRRARR